MAKVFPRKNAYSYLHVDLRLPIYFLMLSSVNKFVNCQSSCTDRANQLGTATSLQECADAKNIHLTKPMLKPPGGDYEYSSNWDRTNSIQDFCILADIYGTTSPEPHPPGKAPKECYPVPPVKEDKSSNISHSAGSDPNWAILEHLTMHHAQSYQPFDDLPYVQPHLHDDVFLAVDPAERTKPLPAENAPNPYFVEVTGISVKGELLQNFLHFRIFANLSVALGKDQVTRDKVLHGKTAQGQEKPNYVTGKISALLIMVKDQQGWPVGDFSVPIPCSRTCKKYSHDVYYGDERNALPCSFTPPYASTHPGMFVFDVDPGRYCTKLHPSKWPKKNVTAPGVNGTVPEVSTDPRDSPHTRRLEGVREVHATWSFGHNTCNFVERLYIQTLIFEDVETVYSAYIKSRVPDPFAYDRRVLFGWTAQYNILKPTRGSLGAQDYVDLEYLRERDSRAPEIDCHVPLFDAEKTVPSSFQKYFVPSHQNIFDATTTLDQTEIKVPSRLGYLGSLSITFSKEKTIRYFGQHAPKFPTAASSVSVCRELPKSFLLSEMDSRIFNDKIPDTVSKYLLQEANIGVRCPCPALASTLPPENRTADPARLHGRLIHASHMAIAYMLLTPVGCFVARYYKETFIIVFCFQEYWWYMWHVVTLIAACLFNIGAITSIARKKSEELIYNDNLTIHIILGAMSIFVFYMEIITGFFRVSNPKKRMRQIFTHWLIGVTNNACAVGSMYAMAWVDQSGFSCKVAYTVTFWLIFVILCYVVMEVDMRKTDKKLRLVPRRTYLPPPVKRLFTKEPPGREFRLFMLAIFICGLIVIQLFVSYYIWNAEGGASCEEEYRAYSKAMASEDIQDTEESGEDGEGDVDEEDTY